MKSISEIDQTSLEKVYARKFLYNIKEESTQYGDSLIPLTDSCFDTNDESKFDMVFVQG